MSKKTKTSLQVAQFVVMLVVMAGGWVYAVASKDAQVSQNTRDIESVIGDHDRLIRIEADVAWLKENEMRKGPR